MNLACENIIVLSPIRDSSNKTPILQGSHPKIAEIRLAL